MRCNDHCLSMAVSFTLSVGKSVCLIAIVAWSIVAILWMVEIAGVRELDCRNTSANKEVSVIKSPGPANKTEKMLKYYLSQIRNRTKFSKQENCTVVIVAHNGFPVLFNLLLHYCRKITWIDSVVVIWNNLNATIPASLTSLNRTCEANLKFIQSSKDRYTNRYLPRKEIETDCVFLIDENRLVSRFDLDFGFEVWQNFRHRIVGFEERGFMIDPNHNYIYVNYERKRSFGTSPSSLFIEIVDGIRILHYKNKTFILGKQPNKISKLSEVTTPTTPTMTKSEGYSIILNSCFIHRAYLEMYFDPLMLPPAAVRYVDNQRDCEDILLNILVTKFLQDVKWSPGGVLAVKSNIKIKSVSENNFYSEHSAKISVPTRPENFQKRSKCLDRFSRFFGYLPLHISNTVVTQV